jgi:menaquinone-9 beta-reductase
MSRATDVFVIGGGPAGLGAAIAARQRGFDVMVADGAHPPIDKPCGEGLMPDACAAIAKLGISVPEQESFSFRGIKFVSGGLSVDASFPQGGGVGVRRTVLHRVMVEKARAIGVRLLWKTPVTGLHRDGVLVGGGIAKARWIVGADGGSSRVRRWAGLDRASGRTRFAFRRHYRISPWSDCMELHWGRKCQIYVTPIALDEVCVAVVSRDARLRLDAALADFPEVALRLKGAECSSAERGAISSTRRLRKVYRGRTVLVGDASGAVDCITGEGLGLGLRQAELLAECLAEGDLRNYQKRHAALARRPALMARLLLALDWKSSLRRRAMRAFGRDPKLFSRMVAMHLGAISPLELAANGVALGWLMLRA